MDFKRKIIIKNLQNINYCDACSKCRDLRGLKDPKYCIKLKKDFTKKEQSK